MSYLNPVQIMKCLLFTLLLQLVTTSVTIAQPPVWLFVSLLEEKKIVSFERNPKTGVLTRRTETDCPAEPAGMSLSPNRKTLFVSYRSSGQLASFHINHSTGVLTPLSVVEGGDDPAFLLPDQTGRFLLSAYYQSDKVAVHRIGRDGTLSAKAVQTIPTARNTHGIAIDTHNQHVFVTHTGGNRIDQFRFDAKSGRLSQKQIPFVRADEHDRPRHIVLHPTDRWAYVSNESGDSLSVFQVDRKSGTLTHIQKETTIPASYDPQKNTTSRCEMTRDGRYVYVANRGHNSIAAFAINPQSGRVTALGQAETEAVPRSFSIDSGGNYLYVAGQASGRIAAYRIQEQGTLTRIGTYESGPVSWWLLTVDAPSSATP